MNITNDVFLEISDKNREEKAEGSLPSFGLPFLLTLVSWHFFA